MRLREPILKVNIDIILLWNYIRYIYVKSHGERKLFKEEFIFFYLSYCLKDQNILLKSCTLLILYMYVHDCGTERILIEFLSTTHLAYQLDL